MVIQTGMLRLLVDPMLSAKGTLAPVNNSKNMRPNPLVELPVDESELNSLLGNIDGILVTHTHRDHFDVEAARIIPKELPIFCQPEDEEKLRNFNFNDVRPVRDAVSWKNINIIRTGGQHGAALLKERMNPVSGYILEAKDEPALYITGDTIWCDEVRAALKEHQPQIVAAFAGEARLLAGGHITMSACDIGRIAKLLPSATVIAVHMEAFNHCGLTREALRAFTEGKKLSDRVLVPENGEQIII